MGFEEQVDEQAFDCCRVVADLVVRAASFRLRSSRFSAGQRSQFGRRACSLPASTARTGSRQISSWSLRSS